jgi:hypothetical protein
MKGAPSVCTHQGTVPIACAQAACMTEDNQEQLLLLPPVHPLTIPWGKILSAPSFNSPSYLTIDHAIAAVAAVTITLL